MVDSNGASSERTRTHQWLQTIYFVIVFAQIYLMILYVTQTDVDFIYIGW